MYFHYYIITKVINTLSKTIQHSLRWFLLGLFVNSMLFRNKKRNNNKNCHHNVSNKVHALPCFQAWSKLKQHKSTAKILHATVMKKPTQPIIPVAKLWRQVWLDSFRHLNFSNNCQWNTQKGQVITWGHTMPEGTDKKSGEHSEIK